MFDKLIESEPQTADFKNRRTYFMASSVIVGVLFLAAVVVSIYAEDFNLGPGSIEMAELIAPVDMAATEPEPVKPDRQPVSSQQQSDVPSRTSNMSRTDESTIVPTTISTTVNTEVARPYGKFVISDRNTDGPGPIGPERPETGKLVGEQTTLVIDDPPETAPPTLKIEPKKPTIIRSSTVLNGKATHLPKPPYPAAAIAVRAEGKVNIQVTIDENGRVISAKAMDGHPLLRGAAEQAARNAKFTPTFLSNVPVKVTGIIIYNFTRN